MCFAFQGRLLGKADAYFSSFRRCNYPRIKAPNAAPEIVYECARYSSFWDIPSAWWQASTVTMGIGIAIAVIGALTLLAAALSFLPHILKTPKYTRILGALQLLAGKCSVSWSSHLLVSSVALLMLCFGLSFCTPRHKPSNPHTDPLRI
ncbi:LHFPL tetraspan subfamily member 1 protein-like isoform X2 [Hylaeus anthracinus]|uniref:LHFPL tetraspan subfamily member 1 protein-like isoform X2 n=1 Tax=Hylaeus anthracinus TaxID=313031 RepID=UPI0023B97366|nr:LHFPL tetraspan subfamily member 1 protein-like isoform X2 [Hylaeus anthracinus]